MLKPAKEPPPKRVLVEPEIEHLNVAHYVGSSTSIPDLYQLLTNRSRTVVSYNSTGQSFHAVSVAPALSMVSINKNRSPGITRDK